MSEQQHALELILDLDAPREKLWRCWTEPKLLEKWFCPKPWYVSDARIDLRPGGEFSCRMHGPNGEEFPNTGVFLEVVPNERLVTTDAFHPGWKPTGRPFMVAEVTFEDLGGGQDPLPRSGSSLDEGSQGRTRTDGVSRRLGQGCQAA